MAEATLSAPLTLDPQQAAKLVIRNVLVEFGARTLQVEYDLVDGTGKLLQRRTVTADGAAVQTWIGNQEATLYARLLAKLGVTGTVA